MSDMDCETCPSTSPLQVVIPEMKEMSLTITEKAKTGPEMALVEGVIPNNIISNVKYSGFIVKYEN